MIALFVANVVLAGVAYRKRRTGLLVWLILIGAAFLFSGKTGFLVLGLIAAALLLGQPLFVLMGTLGLALLATVSGYGGLHELTIGVRKLQELAGKEVLLAIPFFVVAGELMTQGTLARRLIDVMKAAFGFIPGGLAVAAVMGCVFFAAISGSSPVTVVAIGSLMVPALAKAKYPDDFSVGLLTTAGSLGILIPPSIPMIVYAIMVSSSTPVDPMELFVAGVGPGLFIGFLLAAYAITQGIRFKVPREPFSGPGLWLAMRRGFWSLMLPGIILGGIYLGIFTATEAAAVSVVYALAVELFIHRELKLKQLTGVVEASMTVMGSILVIIALALVLNHFLVEEQVADEMVTWLKGKDLQPWQFLLVVNALLLVVGCFMDIMSAILIIAPMLAPMAGAMGINPIHMGIIFIVNLEIGYLTPPVGLNLFVSSSLFKKSLGFVIRAVLPTLAIMIFSLIAITYWPGLSLTAVELFRGKPTPVVAPPSDPKIPAPPIEQPGKVKSLEELMKGTRARPPEGADAPAGEPVKVKSLEELMRDAKQKPAEGAEAPAAEPAKVKSLEELMREAKQKPPAPEPAQ